MIDDLNLELSSQSAPLNPGKFRDARRRKLAHGLYVAPKQPTFVYLTVCSHLRVPWIAKHRVQRLLVDIWQDCSQWIVTQYVLMPDHLHLIAVATDQACDFDTWAIYFRSQYSRRAWNPEENWQTDHWDVRIRSKEHLAEKSLYMQQNPVRAGLVASWEQWPFQGCVHSVDWDEA